MMFSNIMGQATINMRIIEDIEYILQLLGGGGEFSFNVICRISINIQCF